MPSSARQKRPPLASPSPLSTAARNSDADFEAITLTLTEASDLLMCSAETIHRLVRLGYIPRQERGRYRLRATVSGYLDYLRHHKYDGPMGLRGGAVE